ncbi:hypothetical protein R0K17_09540 [Planococcus sp. SIMBA_143]
MAKMKKKVRTYESEHYSDERIEEIKDEFLENLWHMEFTDYQLKSGANYKDGKAFDFEMQCSNDGHFAVILAAKTREEGARTVKDRAIRRDDWMSMAAASAQQTVKTFVPNKNERKNFNWSNLLTPHSAKGEEYEKNSEKNIIFKYMQKGLEKDIHYFMIELDQKQVQRETFKVKGKAVHNNYNYRELDGFGNTNLNDSPEEDDESTLMNLLGEEASIYATYDKYAANHFLDWWRKSKDRILTPNQLELLEKLEEADDEFCDLKLNQMDYTGKTNVSATRKAILNKIEKAWNKENPLGKKTRQQQRKEEELDLWNEFLTIANSLDEEIVEKQNKMLSDWLVQKMTGGKTGILDASGNLFVLDLIYDNLTASEHLMNVTTSIKLNQPIEGKTLYKIIELVEERKINLEMYDANNIKSSFRVESNEYLNKDKPKKKYDALQEGEKATSSHYRLAIKADLGIVELTGQSVEEKRAMLASDQYAMEQAQIEYDIENSIIFRRKI